MRFGSGIRGGDRNGRSADGLVMAGCRFGQRLADQM